MRSIYLILLLATIHLTVWGQTNGTIRGTVRTSDGSPAEYVDRKSVV